MIIKKLLSLRNEFRKNPLKPTESTKLQQIKDYFISQQISILNPDVKYFGISNIPLEKEVKVLEIDPQKIIEKLENLWFEKVFEWYIKDLYYDTPDKAYDKNEKKIRIRQKWEKFIVTFKEDIQDSNIKKSKEVEFPIPWGNQEIFEWIFNDFLGLNLQPFRKKEKYRISYQKTLPNGDIIHIDIDKYKDIPRLLEIEANNEKLIYEYIKKLQLDRNPIKTFWSRWLFQYYWVPYDMIN